MSTQVYVDRFSEVELGDPMALRLVRGRLFVRVTATIDSDEPLLIDGPSAPSVPGRRRLSRRHQRHPDLAFEVELFVLRGRASLASEGGNVLVPQGHRAIARDGAAPSTPEWHNAGQTTAREVGGRA